MGYYYTTELENAVPPNSWVSPKTHTPGSRVSERGQRYFMPEIGRWLSRDPMGELAGYCLYSFLDNEPMSRVDYVGLVLMPVDELATPCTPDFCRDYTQSELDAASAALNRSQGLLDYYNSGRTLLQYISEHPVDVVGSGGRITNEELLRGLPESVRRAYYAVETGWRTYADALHLGVLASLRELFDDHANSLQLENAYIEAIRQHWKIQGQSLFWPRPADLSTEAAS